MPTPELSCNWKRLQSTLQKRKTDNPSPSGTKRPCRPSTSFSSANAVPIRKRTKMSSAPAPRQSPPVQSSMSITTPLPPLSLNAGLLPSVKAGRYLSLDCEMVRTASSPSRLARVSIVNYHLQPVYDSFVLAPASDPVVDYRTAVSGVRLSDLRKGYARPIETVRRDVAALLRGRVLVGHALRNDLEALEAKHPGWATRDTARAAGYRAYAGGRSPALRELARRVLGVEIQGGEHCSVVDARAAMELYKREKKGMDEEVRRKYGRLVERVGEGVLKGTVGMEKKEDDDDVDGGEEVEGDEEEEPESELLDGETDGEELKVATKDVADTEGTEAKKRNKKKKRKHKSRTTRV